MTDVATLKTKFSEQEYFQTSECVHSKEKNERSSGFPNPFAKESGGFPNPPDSNHETIQKRIFMTNCTKQGTFRNNTLPYF